MSMKPPEGNIRRLAALLGQDLQKLSYAQMLHIFFALREDSTKYERSI